jgi:hypothetical protein
MSRRPFKPHDEAVTFGLVPGGKVFVTSEGVKAIGPNEESIGSFATLGAARKALFDLHNAGEAGQVKA